MGRAHFKTREKLKENLNKAIQDKPSLFWIKMSFYHDTISFE